MEARNFKPAKHKATLPNGRDRKPPARFEDWWAKVYVADIIHPAWRSLTASAKDVMLFAIAKSGNAASKGIKNAIGCPMFEFTHSEAKRLLGMPSPTFDRAKRELMEKGFIGVTDPGGRLDGKGRPAKYHLTDKWKEWQATPRDNTNMYKARAARKRGGKSTLVVDISGIKNQNPT